MWCSPLSRAIKDEVPVYYIPQLQILMEILDLVSPFPKLSQCTQRAPCKQGRQAVQCHPATQACSVHVV